MENPQGNQLIVPESTFPVAHVNAVPRFCQDKNKIVSKMTLEVSKAGMS